MKSVNKFFAASILAATASFSVPANATIFQIDYHDAGVWNAYDSDNQAYGMKFRSDQGKDGFWLVVTDGDNPKGDGSSHAILYGDIENNRITAYSYEGTNSHESYQTGTFLGSYENAFSSGGIHPVYGYEMTMFSLDVSDINNSLGSDFDGVSIGENAGIWFHQSAGSEFAYSDNGEITNYVYDSQMWLDRGNDAAGKFHAIDCETDEVRNFGYLQSCNSTQLSGGLADSSSGATTSGGGSVPAPGGLALILVGLAAVGRKFRRANT